VIIAINRADKDKKVIVPVGSIGLRDGAALASLIGSVDNTGVVKGSATLILAKGSASALVVH
jgi:hypothetical protein